MLDGTKYVQKQDIADPGNKPDHGWDLVELPFSMRNLAISL